MTWTYDLSTNIGKVRLRVADTNEDRPVMGDEEYAAFLDMAGDSVTLASAMALETIATNEIMCLKVVNLMGAIVTDSASAAKQLRALAQTLREEYATLGDDGAGFVTIEMVDGPEMREEKFWKTEESAL